MGIPKLSQTQKDVKQINMRAWLESQLKNREMSMRKLSLLMGMSDTYLHRRSHSGDFKGAELVHIGNYLDTNPFEPYRHLLNQNARPTTTERTQAARIAELETLVSSLEKERDIYKEIVIKK